MKTRDGIAIIILAALIAACPMDGPGGGDDPPSGDDTPAFGWSDPKAPDAKSSFQAAEYVAESQTSARDLSSSRALISGDEFSGAIDPDSLKVAYRYIALVADEVVRNIAAAGIYGIGQRDFTTTNSDWDSADIAEYLSGDMSGIPGFNTSHYPEAEVTYDSQLEYEAYIASSGMPVTTADLQVNAFVIYDGTKGTESIDDDELAVFDLASSSFKVEVTATPPEGVAYTGIAYEIVYYEAAIDGFGLIRHYYNDFGVYKAGDFVVNKNGVDSGWGGDLWKWAYLKHGDGPDSWDGSAVPAISGGGYDNVWAPLPEPEAPYDPSSWSPHDHGWQAYNGYYPFNGNNVPVFFHLESLTPTASNNYGWGDVSGGPNLGKRPVPSAACCYMMLTYSMMNTAFNDGGNMVQLLHPVISKADVVQAMADYEAIYSGYQATISGSDPWDQNPGGFLVYNQAAPKESTPIRFGDFPAADASIYGSSKNANAHLLEDGYRPNKSGAYLVYYESDDHLGDSDISKVFYSDSRLPDSQIISRTEMTEKFGVYAYDSGLISQVYDDSRMVQAFSSGSGMVGKFPTLLDLAMGRYCVLGRRYPDPNTNGPYVGYVYDPPYPTAPDSLADTFVEVAVRLEIDVGLKYREDCVGRTWDAGTIGDTDFEGRFLSFVPNVAASVEEYSSSPYASWGTDPNGPVPAQRGFYGPESDDHQLETDLGFNLDHFNIQVTNVMYRDVYSLSPSFHPDPSEGPFSADQGLSITLSYSGGETITYYYTTDGTDPTTESALYNAADGISIGTTDTLIKVIVVEEGKLPSKIAEAQYCFALPGTDVGLTVGGLPSAALGKNALIGLFTQNTVDLDQGISPAYYGMAAVGGASVIVSIKDVNAGTYYVFAIIDMDNSNDLSAADLIYPAAGEDRTVSLSGSTLTVPESTSYTATPETWGNPPESARGWDF